MHSEHNRKTYDCDSERRPDTQETVPRRENSYVYIEQAIENTERPKEDKAEPEIKTGQCDGETQTETNQENDERQEGPETPIVVDDGWGLEHLTVVIIVSLILYRLLK